MRSIERRRTRTTMALGTALLSLTILTGCGIGGSSTPSANAPAATHTGHHHKPHKHPKKHAVRAYRVTTVAATGITVKAGPHTYTVPVTVPVYFEASPVSEATWVKSGERVKLLGGTTSPSAMVLLPSAQGTVSSVSAQSITLSTAAGKSLTLSLPASLLSTDIATPLKTGQALAGLTVKGSSSRTLVGVATRPTVTSATLVSVTGHTVVVALNGKNSAPLPFLGPQRLLGKLTAGRTIKVLLGLNGVALAGI